MEAKHDACGRKPAPAQGTSTFPRANGSDAAAASMLRVFEWTPSSKLYGCIWLVLPATRRGLRLSTAPTRAYLRRRVRPYHTTLGLDLPDRWVTPI